jgi:hypothetical protein
MLESLPKAKFKEKLHFWFDLIYFFKLKFTKEKR